MKISDINFNKYKYIIMSSIILALIIGIFAVIKIFYIPDSDKKEEVTENASVSTTQMQADGFAGDNSILFICNNDNVGDALFAVIFDFHIYSEKIVVTPLDLSVSDGEKTYSEYYRYSGVDALMQAVENVRKTDIDRYMIIDKSGIGDFTEALGNVKLYVEEDYTYLASDKSYEVKAGSNELESEMLFSYLRIICSKPDGLTRLCDVICTIANSYIADMKPDDALDLFGDICNSVTTDITISDFYSWENDIVYLLSHETECVAYDRVEQ